MIELRKIDKTNYEECIGLHVGEDQKAFVAPNIDSLVTAAYEDDMYTLAIYSSGEMVGFILYDLDPEISGWSMSRLMIDVKYQNRGFGKKALTMFLELFYKKHGHETLYTSAEVDNIVAIKMYLEMGFHKNEEFEYEHNGTVYREVRLVKNS